MVAMTYRQRDLHTGHLFQQPNHGKWYEARGLGSSKLSTEPAHPEANSQQEGEWYSSLL